MDKTTIAAFVVFVPMSRFGSTMDDLRLMEKINKFAPKDGLYGVNLSTATFRINLLYMSKRYAENAVSVLRMNGVKAKLDSRRCCFDADTLTDEFQKAQIQEAEKDGSAELLRMAEDLIKAEKEADKRKADADSLRQTISELEKKLSIAEASITSALAINNKLTGDLAKEKEARDKMLKKYEHIIEKLTDRINELEEKTNA